MSLSLSFLVHFKPEFSFFFPICAHACTCACACVWGGTYVWRHVCMHVDTHVYEWVYLWRSKVMSRTHSPCCIHCGRVPIKFRADWMATFTGQPALGWNLTSQAEIKGGPLWAFPWVLGIHTQVLPHERSLLYSLSYLHTQVHPLVPPLL